MNELCINALYHSFYGETDELWHHGILGMKWGIRRYQPYGQGYDAEHKGRFLGKLFSKGKTTAKGISDYYKTNGLSDLKSGAKEFASKIKSNKVVSGYADAARQLADFGKSVGKRAGMKVSDAIGNLGDGFEVIKKEFGPDLQRTVGSLKTKASSATSSIGAAFLSVYLGDPYSGNFKMRANNAINKKSKRKPVSEQMSSIIGMIGRNGRSKLSDIGDNLQAGKSEWKSSLPKYMQDALSKQYGLQDLSKGSTWRHVDTGRLVGRDSQAAYWDRINPDLRKKGKQADTSIIPGYPGFGGGGYGVSNDSYREEARLLSQLKTLGGEETPEYKKYKKLLGWQ